MVKNNPDIIPKFNSNRNNNFCFNNKCYKPITNKIPKKANNQRDLVMYELPRENINNKYHNKIQERNHLGIKKSNQPNYVLERKLMEKQMGIKKKKNNIIKDLENLGILK